MNGMTILWLALIAVTLVIEIFTMGLTTIWFSFGGIVAAIASGAGAPLYLQFTLFCVSSLASMLLVRPYALRMQRKGKEKTNVDELIGKEFPVYETIDNRRESGLIRIHGIEWMARSVDGSVIEKEENVIVESISGVKLMVRKAENNSRDIG